MRLADIRATVSPFLFALGLIVIAPGAAPAQVPNQVGVRGLALPGVDAEASLDEMLAAFDRSPDMAVAEVGSRAITWGDVADAIRTMPRIVAGIPLKELYENAAFHVMEQKALARLGENTGLDKDPNIQRRMKSAADEVLASEVLRRSIAPAISTEALRRDYDRLVASKPGPEQVRAKIIMVDTEEEASALIKKLHGGSDFVTLARGFSKDGTAANGGDLGYVTLSMLAPEIGSVAFALGVGQTSEYPVRSGNFWFIVKVDGRGSAAPPDFETARAALAQDVIHAAIPGLKQTALREAPMKIYGQPVPAQTTRAGN